MASLYDHRRAFWTSVPLDFRAHPFDHTVRGAYIHHPATSARILEADDDRIAGMLRGWRNDHRANGWFDIGYNVAVDGRGHVWELRGIGIEGGANGGTASNNEGVSILLLCGNAESPSEAMIAGVNRVLAAIKAKYPTASYIRGHRQSPDASTDCPGTRIMNILGRLSYDGGERWEAGSYDRDLHREVQRRLGQPVDGRLGAGDLAALCRFLGLPEYDVISDQPRTALEVGDAIVPSIWDHDPDHTGPNSRVVRALEAYTCVTVDRGSWGPELSAGMRTMMRKYPAFLTAADAGVAAARIAAAGE